MLSKLAVLPLVIAGAASAPAQAEEVWFVTARYEKPEQLQALASQFQHLIVDRENRSVKLEADAATIAALRAGGYEIEIDQAASNRLHDWERDRHAGGGIKSIPGYACYRTVEETQTTMSQLAAQKPNLAEVIDIGPSWEKTRNAANGYTLKVLRLGNKGTDATIADKANMVVLSGLHAREYTPAETMTRFAEWLVNGYGSDAEATWLMDHFRFHLVLQSNPDGRKKAEAGLSWRKNTNNTNGSCGSSSYGTDLNRNFPFHWNSAPGGSSGDPCNETYRGPVRASEPETQAIINYVAGTLGSNGSYSGGVFPDRRADAVSAAAPEDYKGVFMDIHSYAQLVLWPWGDTATAAPNGTALRTFGRRLAYFNGYYPQQSDELYATDGATDDNMYGSLGVPAFTIELGVAFFESCTTFQNTTLPQNLAALRYAARNLQAPYKLPAGPDTTSISVSPASVAAGGSVTVTASVDDSRFSTRNGSETVQAIASAAAYVDAAPWQAGAAPLAMSAVDGSFNASAESVRVTINTSSLAPGVHTVFVQGTDAAGKPGTPNAVRFTVTDGGGNQPPVASFSVAANGLGASFTDTSTDSDGSIAARSWDFGDGATSTAANPSHSYAAAGTYTVALTVTDNGGASHSTTRQVTVSSGGGNVLQNGVPASGLSGAANSSLAYTIVVPAGASNLNISTSGGSGDADLYVRFGSAPTTSTYDCRPYKSGNAETCTFATPQAGTYHILLRGYSAYSGLSLLGSYTTGGSGGTSFENGTDFAIGDNSTVESPITVSGIAGNAPAALKASVTINHTYQGDLKVDLVAPNGTVFNLWNRSGGGTDNIIQTFTVNASAVAANGVWKLRVNDNGPGDTGTLDRWGLQF
ncbi:M14 family zinc carboxypeptidase [Tahibacter harae]|uniref:Proprotein convertase P-domain-containing protein n=1 Tax=Tahibacter harae TaxID=2963937 RepID=A0ABT1QTV5_9GAMM|nr:M14 family zinc carboxypeptidase [Tahibacter harae]MCQ4165701.1 proprotein convertase P-domain-containing protein [Tahibacter harae]